MSTPVLSSADLGPGEMRTVTANGRKFLVGRTNGGEVFGVAWRCPHHGADLAGGRVEEMIVADAEGNPRLSDRVVVRCPWHRYEFDIESGKCPLDAKRSLRRFSVIEADGMIALA